MSKKVKEFELAALRKRFQGVKDYILVEPLKADAAADFTFRKKLRDGKIQVAMVKNTLAKKVLAENGVAIDKWASTTLLCWGGESVKGLANAVATQITESKKDPKSPERFKVKTAVADGQIVTFELAKTLPTRKEAIGELLAAILGPGGFVAGCINGPGSQVAGLVAAVEEKAKSAPGADVPGGDAAPAADAPPAA